MDAPEADPTCAIGGQIANANDLGHGAIEATVADAWKRHGEAVLDRLKGHFTLLLWSPSERRGLIVRDRMGAC